MTNLLFNLLSCPNCKDSLEQGISSGFAWSIGLMLAVPLAIAVVWSVVIFRFTRASAGQLVTHRG